jgi:hypothetical protein
MALPAALVAALPGWLAYLLANISMPVGAAIAVGVLVALPLFLIITFLPLGFISGMFGVFLSNIWTLAFRSLQSAGATLPLSTEVPPSLPYQAPVEE